MVAPAAPAATTLPPGSSSGNASSGSGRAAVVAAGVGGAHTRSGASLPIPSQAGTLSLSPAHPAPQASHSGGGPTTEATTACSCFPPRACGNWWRETSSTHHLPTHPRTPPCRASRLASSRGGTATASAHRTRHVLQPAPAALPWLAEPHPAQWGKLSSGGNPHHPQHARHNDIQFCRQLHQRHLGWAAPLVRNWEPAQLAGLPPPSPAARCRLPATCPCPRGPLAFTAILLMIVARSCSTLCECRPPCVLHVSFISHDSHVVIHEVNVTYPTGVGGGQEAPPSLGGKEEGVAAASAATPAQGPAPHACPSPNARLFTGRCLTQACRRGSPPGLPALRCVCGCRDHGAGGTECWRPGMDQHWPRLIPITRHPGALPSAQRRRHSLCGDIKREWGGGTGALCAAAVHTLHT